MASDTVSNIVCSGGIILAKETKRFLFLLRNKESVWGFVGGQKEPFDQTPFEALNREITEEISSIPKIEKTVPLELYVSNDGKFHYHTYVLIVEKEFIPVLNGEHNGYAWVSYGNWPKPLHQAVKTSLSNRTNKTKLELILDLI
jgi:8-oxo-dGTP pyrophosphatase MutT (NUDIX family)